MVQCLHQDEFACYGQLFLYQLEFLEVILCREYFVELFEQVVELHIEYSLH